MGEMTLYDLLDEKGYHYDYIHDGWIGKEQGQFFSTKAVNEVPGEVRYFLLTGEVRSDRIFDPGYDQPSFVDVINRE